VQALGPIAGVMSFARDWTTRFVGVQGVDRSMAIGAQAYTALFPLLIVYGALLPRDRNFADTLIKRFDLSGTSAATVRQAFASTGTVEASLTVIGIVLLIYSALSFTRGLQRLYEGSFGLPTLGVRNTRFALLWLVVMCASAGVRPLVLGIVNGLADTILSLTLSGVVWLLTPYLLLGRRVRWQHLAPVAVLSTIGMTGVGIWSVLWMPQAIATSSRQFGVIGVGFALLTWLVAIGGVLVAAATGGATIADRWERRDA
jgi:membrane protein